jgi:hypothetical protein
MVGVAMDAAKFVVASRFPDEIHVMGMLIPHRG